MPNYQLLANEPLTYITLQNAHYTEDAGFCESFDEINATIPYSMTKENNGPYLEIVEQPANTFRYRYKSEKGSHGGIKGENSTRSKKSYPTIKVQNCPSNLRKKIVVKVSLYMKDDLKLHVYELTGKNAGGARLDENFMAKFQSLAITTRKKEEVLEILKERKKSNYDLDEFYDEAILEAQVHEEMKSINLDSARLCFEAFSDGNNTPLCEKLFSSPINNQKSAATGDLKIIRLSRCSGKCSGDDEVFLLCDKVKKEDIKVRFFDVEENWEAFAEFNFTDIHYQVAIVFKTPKYKENIYRKVSMELFRPSDDTHSESRPFQYIPADDDIHHPSNRKFLNADIDEDESCKISKKRKIENLEDELFKSLFNSSLVDSPSSIGMESCSDNWKLFFNDSDLLLCDNQDSNEEGHSHLYTLRQEAEKIPQFLEVDGLNDISKSMNSMSLMDRSCKKESKARMQKESINFAIGMKKILLNRHEITYLQYASHLVPLQDENGNSILHLGIMEQCENLNFILKMVKMASEDVINLQNKLKETTLHLAVKGNHTEILLFLLVKGGNPNLTDRNGNNCLHLAAKHGHMNCLKILMSTSENRTWKHAMSDVDVLNYDGMSALHIAVTRNFKECVKLLLNSKADINLFEKKCGRTSLHLAIEHPSLLPVILKQPNVDITAEDFGGCTAVQLVCLKIGNPFEIVSEQLKDGKDEIVKFLEDFYQDAGCGSRCNEAESDWESTDSSEFEDAIEDFSLISSNDVVCKAMCSNGNKSSLMKIEAELHEYLDRDDNWKILANLIDLDTKHVTLLDEGLSPGQTVLRKIKDLYHPCQLQTIIGMLQLAGLEEGVQILQKNS